MTKVKINGKTYNVGELEFAEYSHMEDQGFSIVDAFRKGQLTLIAIAFTCVAVGCERDEAEHLIQQHIMGGGSIIDIADAFRAAVDENDFFRRMLGLTKDEPEQKTEKAKKEKAEE